MRFRRNSSNVYENSKIYRSHLFILLTLQEVVGLKSLRIEMIFKGTVSKRVNARGSLETWRSYIRRSTGGCPAGILNLQRLFFSTFLSSSVYLWPIFFKEDHVFRNEHRQAIRPQNLKIAFVNAGGTRIRTVKHRKATNITSYFELHHNNRMNSFIYVDAK